MRLRDALEKWFNQLGSDDPKWWAKELYAYFTMPDEAGHVFVVEESEDERLAREWKGGGDWLS